MITMETTEEVSSRGVEKCAERHKWQRSAPFAREKPWVAWKKGLVILWSRKRIAKKPMLVVGKKPNGKCQLKSIDLHHCFTG
jgi:hypothetical protein